MKTTPDPFLFTRIALFVLTSTALAAPVQAQVPRLYSFYGDRPDETLGTSVRGAGDVNQDGYDDVIIGATDGNGASTEAGEAHVFSGRDGSLLYTFQAHEAGTAFGAAVGGAGDVNADGYADLVVGARYDDTSAIFAGAVYVFSGRDGKLLHDFFGDSEGDRLGNDVSGTGDVDADGYDDVIAGAYFDSNNGFWSGSASIFSGRTGRILHTFDGDAEFDFFGVSVSGAGDVNADGHPDVIVGAYGNDESAPNAGLARVHSGADGSVLHDFHGAAADDAFGVSVSGAGDVDRDGHADLIVGAWMADAGASGTGTATVFSGLDGSTLYTFHGEREDDHFGFAVSAAGDFNGDSVPDLIAGAYFNDHNGEAAGSARIFSGANGSALTTLFGDSPDDRFGVSVGGAGDVNGDGFGDVIVGAIFDDTDGFNAGSAHVYAGVRFPRQVLRPRRP